MEISRIGEKIKSKRQVLGMTQKDLADAMHISSQLVSKWERNESVPSLEYFDSLCNALQCTQNYLLGYSKKKAKLKTWDELGKLTKTIIVSFITLLFTTATSLILGYVIVPAICKDAWANEMSNSIERNLELGYYNIKYLAYVDSERTNTYSLNGYIDENGDPVYENSYLYQIINHGYKKESNYRNSIYRNDENIHTLNDLFKNQLQSIGSKNTINTNVNDIKYINKTSYGFYLEFDNNIFNQMVENKNYTLNGKIKGWFKYQNNYFKSLTIAMKVYDENANKYYDIRGVAEFVFEKNEIKDSYFTDGAWKFSDNDLTDLNETIKTITNNSENQISADLYEQLYSSEVFTNGEEFIVISDDSLTILDENLSLVNSLSGEITTETDFEIESGSFLYKRTSNKIYLIKSGSVIKEYLLILNKDVSSPTKSMFCNYAYLNTDIAPLFDVVSTEKSIVAHYSHNLPSSLHICVIFDDTLKPIYATNKIKSVSSHKLDNKVITKIETIDDEILCYIT